MSNIQTGAERMPHDPSQIGFLAGQTGKDMRHTLGRSEERLSRNAETELVCRRRRDKKDSMPHTELAEIVLDESCYTETWQNDRSAVVVGRLENLYDLVCSMQPYVNSFPTRRSSDLLT